MELKEVTEVMDEGETQEEETEVKEVNVEVAKIK